MQRRNAETLHTWCPLNTTIIICHRLLSLRQLKNLDTACQGIVLKELGCVHKEGTDPSSRERRAKTIGLADAGPRNNRDVESPKSPPATVWCPPIVEDGFCCVTSSQQLSAASSLPAKHASNAVKNLRVASCSVELGQIHYTGVSVSGRYRCISSEGLKKVLTSASSILLKTRQHCDPQHQHRCMPQ